MKQYAAFLLSLSLIVAQSPSPLCAASGGKYGAGEKMRLGGNSSVRPFDFPVFPIQNIHSAGLEENTRVEPVLLDVHLPVSRREILGVGPIEKPAVSGFNQDALEQPAMNLLEQLSQEVQAEVEDRDSNLLQPASSLGAFFDKLKRMRPGDEDRGDRSQEGNGFPSQAPIFNWHIHVLPPLSVPIGPDQLDTLSRTAGVSKGSYVLFTSQSLIEAKTEMGHLPTAILARTVGMPDSGTADPSKAVARLEILREATITGYARDPGGHVVAHVIYPKLQFGDPKKVGRLMGGIISSVVRLAAHYPVVNPIVMKFILTIRDSGEIFTHLFNHLKLPDKREQMRMNQEILVSPSLEARLEIMARALERVEVPAGGDGADVETHDDEGWTKKIEDSGMPEQVKRTALREFRKMSALDAKDPSKPEIAEYLERLSSLPWKKTTQDRTDLRQGGEILDRDHYGLEEVKERVLEFLAMRKRSGSMKGEILCFVGPPGTGKTSVAKGIAEALGRKFVNLRLGGMATEASIRGYDRAYKAANMGQIMQAIRQAGTRNPVLLLDEIDKLGHSGEHGDPAAALLETLDPEQNHSFKDNYLNVPFDLSDVFFITTANGLDSIPPPLRDRMEIIEFSPYTTQEKIEIAQRHIIPEILGDSKLNSEQVRFEPEALRRMIEGYTRESGVRKLKLAIRRVAAKIVYWLEEGGLSLPQAVRAEELGRFLGVERYASKDVAENGVGVATGLAVGGDGGSMFNIEITLKPGSRQLRFQKNMKEYLLDSADNAYNAVWNSRRRLGISDEDFQSQDMDVSITPAAAADGPSAGVTLVTAMVSAFTQRPVKRGVAMTGEVSPRTLRVMEIGGLKEKALAAYAAGYHTVIYPAGNEKDIEKLPKEARQKLRLIPVRTLQEVLDEALEPAEPASASHEERPSAPSVGHYL